MGEVYRARDARLQRDVAVKVLPQALSLDADRLRRFEQEALATAALNHPNILAVFDMGTHEGAPYVVSELLEGETLREKTAQRRHCNVQDFRVCVANFQEPWRTFGAISSGVEGFGAPHFSADGNACAYVYQRVLPERMG